MATSSEIKQRANALAGKTDVNSITPKEVGGIMYDLASHGENVLRNGGTLGIRKVYESVASMEADSTNPKDFWGDPIKKGNLVVIYDGTTTGVDNNKIYAFMKPGWELATKLDAAYATKAETDAKLSELGSEVGNLKESVGTILSSKVWSTSTSSAHIVLKVSEGDEIYIKSSGETCFAFLKSYDENIVNGNTADISDIDNNFYQNKTGYFTTPSDSQYFFVRTKNANKSVAPSELKLNGYDCFKTIYTNAIDSSLKVGIISKDVKNIQKDTIVLKNNVLKKVLLDTINAIIGIDSKEWVSSSSALSCFIPVKENDIVQYELSSTGRISFLKDKKTSGVASFSDKEGFTDQILGTGEKVVPSDVNYISVRLVNNGIDVSPSLLKINGVNCLLSLDDRLTELENKTIALASSCTNSMCSGEKYVQNHLGINVHFGKESQIRVLPDLIDSISNIGANLIRSGNIPSAYPLYEKGCTLIGSAHYIRENLKGYTVNYPTNVDGNFEETFAEWERGFIQLIQMYDGTKRELTDPLCIVYNGEAVAMKIDYWEGFNEIDLNASPDRYNLSPSQILRIIKRTYEIVHQYNKDAKVLNGGLSSVQDKESVRSIFEVTDENGYHFWRYIDIFNFHYYAFNSTLVDIVDATKKRLEFWFKYSLEIDSEKNLYDMPVWITEFGDRTYYVSQDEQAIRLIHWFLYSFAIGADKVCYYQLIDTTEVEIEKSRTYGIIEFENDGSIKNKLAFKSFRTLSKLYTNGSSKVSIKKCNGLNIASWQMGNGAGCFAMFTDSQTTESSVAESKRISCNINIESDSVIAFDYLGERVNISENMTFDSKPIFFKGVNQIVLTKIEEVIE